MNTIRNVGFYLLSTVLPLGCRVVPSHIHNEENAKLAAEVKEEFTAYKDAAPTMYAAMLENVERFREEEEYVIAELEGNAHDALITAFPSMTWSTIKNREQALVRKIHLFESEVKVEAERFLNERRVAKARFSDAKAAVKAAKAEVEVAEKNLTAWNAYVALLQGGIKDLPLDLILKSGKVDMESLVGVSESVAKQKISYENASGESVEEELSKVVGRFLPEIEFSRRSENSPRDSNRDGRLDLRDVKVGDFRIPDAPGMELVILNLGLELAQNEQQQAAIHLAQISARAALFEDALAEMRLARVLADELSVDTSIDFIAGGGADSSTTTIEDMMHWAAEARTAEKNQNHGELTTAHDKISRSMVRLRKLAVAESIIRRNEARFRVQVARLEHQQSIVNSSTNDLAWQALIGSGVDGVDAFHAGGVTKDDVSNLLSAAQAIALAFIAANVD